MIPVHILAPSAVLRAGLEAVICSTGTLSLGGAERAEVVLAALTHLNEDSITQLSNYSQPVVVLADLPEAPLLAAALRGNIRGMLAPEASAEEIVAAVTSAAAGLVTLQPLGLEILSQTSRPSSEILDDPLTPRELEVLAMLAEGLSNKLLAYRLGISEHTVKFHVTSILTKLQAGSRTDAVMQGIRRGLIMM
jgi:two-component system, NarL family, response regulator YdfI